MSNLGLYQWFTTTAKKVGGPARLIEMFIGCGAILGSAVTYAVVNKYRGIKAGRTLKTLGKYSVISNAEDKKIDLDLKIGDEITVFASDGDTVLIVKNKDKNRPYFVSSEFLNKCSDYKTV